MLTGDDPKDRLLQAKSFYEFAWDHVDRYKWSDEVQTDEEYQHGCQWAAADLEYLKKQRRPALVFNIIQAKILHLVGAHEDNLEVPIAAAVGIEDQMAADVLNHLRDRIWAEIEGNDIDAEVWERGVICGIGNSAIDAMPDPDDPSMLKISLYPLSPYEVLWDPASERRDRSDARYVLWHRWLSRAEFKQEYPEKADRIDEIFHERFGLSNGRNFTEPSPGRAGEYRDRRGMLYYDRHRDQVRVIRMEYRASTKRLFAVDPVTDESREVDAEELRILRKLSPEIESSSSWSQEIRWLEFVGDEILFDDTTPLPIDGFSITPNICHQDQHNLPYGKIRQLRDPQNEVNKRLSQTLLLLSQQAAPGVIAEPDAFVNEADAEQKLKEAGSIVKAQKGAISQQRILERHMPQFPDAPFQLHQQAIKLVDLISGIWSDQLTEPRGIPEAAATAQLKHRQSLLAMRPVMRGFQAYQRQVLRKLLQIIVRAMPDEQISRLLGNAKKYQVHGHVVMDVQTGRSTSLATMRDLQYNVEVRPAEENSSQRLMELQMLIQLQTQMPIDPNVIIDYLALPSDRKDQLRDYVKQSAESQARSGAEQMAQSMAQLKHVATMDVLDRKLEAGRLMEETRHNQAAESIKAAAVGEQIGKMISGHTLEEQQQILDLTVAIINQKAAESRAARGSANA